MSAIGECIYIKQWHERERAAASLRPATAASTTSPIPDKRVLAGGKQITDTESSLRNGRLSVQDDAKLIFGVIFSLRNMVRKLSTPLVPPFAPCAQAPSGADASYLSEMTTLSPIGRIITSFTTTRRLQI